MRVILYLLVVPVLAQTPFSEKETALRRSVSHELRRQTQPLAHPILTPYLAQLSDRLGAPLELVDSAARDPQPLPDGSILVPWRLLATLPDEPALLARLAHAVGHLAVSPAPPHNRSGGPVVFLGGWLGLHTDPAQPLAFPLAGRATQAEAERAADRHAQALLPTLRSDPPAFAAAQAAARQLLPARKPPTLQRAL
jgi:hypothetical protein